MERAFDFKLVLLILVCYPFGASGFAANLEQSRLALVLSRFMLAQSIHLNLIIIHYIPHTTYWYAVVV